MPRSRALFAFVCVAGLACKRPAPPTPLPVTSEAKPLPPPALSSSLVVIAHGNKDYSLHEFGDAVFAKSDAQLARIDGGRFEPAPLPSKSFWPTSFLGHWPDRAYAMSVHGGCRGPTFVETARFTDGKWQLVTDKKFLASDQSWGDGRILRNVGGKVAWVTEDGVDETNVPTVDATFLGASCKGTEIYIDSTSARWTIAHVTVRCDSTSASYLDFVWRPGELVGKPVPAAKMPSFNVTFVDAKGMFWGESYVPDASRYDQYFYEGGDWKLMQPPLPNATIVSLFPSSTGLVAMVNDGANRQIWRRDGAGQWARIVIEDDAGASPLNLDRLFVHGDEIWVNAHREGGENVLLHNGKAKSFE
jgi:hypothetical protein